MKLSTSYTNNYRAKYVNVLYQKRLMSENINPKVALSLRKRIAILSSSIGDDRYFYVNNDFKNIKEIETYIVSSINTNQHTDEYKKIDNILNTIEKEYRDIKITTMLERVDNSIDSFHSYALLIMMNIVLITVLITNL